jgi:hypothetical protein
MQALEQARKLLLARLRNADAVGGAHGVTRRNVVLVGDGRIGWSTGGPSKDDLPPVAFVTIGNPARAPLARQAPSFVFPHGLLDNQSLQSPEHLRHEHSTGQQAHTVALNAVNNHRVIDLHR